MVYGIIGKKLGITQIFRESGEVAAVTAIEAGPCYVTQVKTEARDGYNAVQLGFAETNRLNSPERGHAKKSGHLLRYLREFRVADPSALQVGQKIDVSLFQSGELVDISGTSKGRGFAGVVKRHHFAGGPKSHGQSDRHRAPGSIGSTTFPGRVYKGKRMAGHMGNARITVRHLQVVRSEPDRNLLWVKGAVPGSLNGLLLIKKCARWERDNANSGP